MIAKTQKREIKSDKFLNGLPIMAIIANISRNTPINPSPCAVDYNYGGFSCKYQEAAAYVFQVSRDT
ncbi:MAG: hypothetical protein NT166_21760 [Candidatus Aminicenantes bacterium]|nr:hypothetical protein [Candidatus Aminicenantes bacterium]